MTTWKLLRNALKISSSFLILFVLRLMYCRDVACYVSTRPYFFEQSKKWAWYFQSFPLYCRYYLYKLANQVNTFIKIQDDWLADKNRYQTYEQNQSRGEPYVRPPDKHRYQTYVGLVPTLCVGMHLGRSASPVLASRSPLHVLGT